MWTDGTSHGCPVPPCDSQTQALVAAHAWRSARSVPGHRQSVGAHSTRGLHRGELRFQGERPLTDQKHAAIQNWLVGLLRHAGWVVEAEVSFNHYGDRGRIDVMALHSSLSCLLVAEIKTRIVDVQELLGGVDVKRRIARTLATERGWPATSVVGAIVVRESTTTRRRLQAHRDLFAGYGVRGRAGMAWLRRPRTPIPKGILALVTAPDEPN